MEHLKKIKKSERYLKNARELLKKAGRENGYYRDGKYVRSACGTAYLGSLLAADAYLDKKGKTILKKKGGRKNVDDYTKILAQLNKKVLHSFNTAYYVLHISGYYDGVLNAKIINVGFEAYEELIEAAKK
jgi:hypothetical protein